MKISVKKILCLLLAVLLLPAMAVNADTQNKLPFKDIPAEEWYYSAVSYVYDNSLFVGTSEASFEPETVMTRAMFVKVLANMTNNYIADNSGKSSYSDVPSDSWYASVVQWAGEVGLVTGTGSGKFSPEDMVTREQIATILYRYARLTGNAVNYLESSLSTYSDNKNVSEWAKASLAWAVSNGVINGNDNKQLQPSAGARRCEVAQIFKNAKSSIITNVTVDATAGNPDSAYITADEAKQIALKHAGLTADVVTFTEVELDWDDGHLLYEIEFYNNATEYDYEIDAYTGEILSIDYDAESHNHGSGGTGHNYPSITVAEARNIALNHAKLSISDVTFTKTELDRDNGRLIFEIEFYYNGSEYDYEIDAKTGQIISVDYENEGYRPSPGPDSITLARAKEIALNHAGVSASEVTFVKVDLDRDDGRFVYEIDFHHGGKEYEYEIDADTGRIISVEQDNNHHNPGATAITMDRAKEIALKHAGVSASDVTFTKTKLDEDDGRLIYEIDFHLGRVEYEYDIDATTGVILDYEIDR